MHHRNRYSVEEHEALRMQNHRIVSQLAKQKADNSMLQKKINALMLSRLNLLKPLRDVATQTENDETECVADNILLASPVRRSTSPRRVSKVVSPEDNYSYNPMLPKPQNSDETLRFSTEELVGYSSSHSNTPTPGKSKQSSHRRSPCVGKLGSPKLVLSPHHVKSPLGKKKISTTISDRITRALFPTTGMSPLADGSDAFSPSGVASPKMPPTTEEGANTATDNAVPQPLKRSPRRVRQPVSYKEPSLTVKVRKGFKFIRFQELVEEGGKVLVDLVAGGAAEVSSSEGDSKNSSG